MDKSLSEILSEYGISLKEFNQNCDDYTNYELFESDDNDELILRNDGSPKLKAKFEDLY